MIKLHVETIINHEADYVKYIESGTYDTNKDFTDLTNAVMFLGREHPSKLMSEFNNKYQGIDLDLDGAIFHTVAFLDNILSNDIKTKEDFSGMSEKEVYIYTLKRLLFNKRVLVNCSKCAILEELLGLVLEDNIGLPSLSDYFPEIW